MSFELEHLFFAGSVYLMLLFFIAYATEQGWIPDWVVRHPITYVLSLGVYASSWSFYGSVGFAGGQGFLFLTIYLGVTLAFALAPVLLVPLLRLARDYQLTSLADVLAFRYHSQTAGALVTLFMLVGTTPYIALQILAVTESIQILTQEEAPKALAFGFCAMLTLFAILFGARHVSPREKHEGLVAAIAFESLVKLFALCAVGLFAVFGVFGGLGGIDDWLVEHPEALDALYRPVREGPWSTLLLLSFCAAFLLPRQFHMAFAENLQERSLFVASWAFPLFLLLLNLFIPAILWAAIDRDVGGSPDYYVLGITLSSNSRLLTSIAFLGGVSAASAMVIVTTLALAGMCLNHLLLPASVPDPAVDLYRWLLWGRRMLIGLILLIGYGFYLVLERNQALAQLGLISFVAVAQFLPGILGILYWPRATRAGFIAGLLGGGAVWAVTLLLPLLYRSGLILDGSGMASLVVLAGEEPWSRATMLSLAVNCLLFFGISLFTEPSTDERAAADACCRASQGFSGGVVVSASSPGQFRERLARILGKDAAAKEVAQALADLGMDADERNPGALRRLRERIERNLSGLMGPMLAQIIVDERLQTDEDARSALADNIRFIEEKVEGSRSELRGVAAELDSLRRYHQQILRDLPIGVCAVDSARTIVSWNLAMETLSGVDRFKARGVPVSALPAPWPELFADILDADVAHLPKVQAQVDGRARWFNLHMASIDDPSSPGEFGGTVVLVEDLTGVQTLEAELTHSDRLAFIGRLAAGVAHEIGNPVTGIACLAQNLESESADDFARETSEQILVQTKRINTIVRSLASFSRSGELAAPQFEAVNVSNCVDEAVRLVQLSHAARQVICENHCPRDLTVHGDAPRLVQVFVNLLSNACDASKAGDTVTVRAARADGRVTVDVVDTGEGIAEEVAEHLFEPFVTTKPPGKGTGLGLSLVHTIVEDHGGSIAVDTQPGMGTLIAVTLPLDVPPGDEHDARGDA